MKAAGLYLITAAATGLLVFYLAMEGIYGAPVNRSHYVSFGGSVLVALAAFVAPFRPRAAAVIALAGCLASWCFYAPAIVLTFFRQPSWWAEMRFALSYRDYVPAFDPILAPLLLIASTAYAIRVLRCPRQLADSARS